MCYLLPFTALLAVMCKVQGAKKYGALTALAVLFGLPILISAPMFFMGRSGLSNPQTLLTGGMRLDSASLAFCPSNPRHCCTLHGSLDVSRKRRRIRHVH